MGKNGSNIISIFVSKYILSYVTYIRIIVHIVSFPTGTIKLKSRDTPNEILAFYSYVREFSPFFRFTKIL